MKTDRTTKILLFVIALGLWVNVVAPLASAQVYYGNGTLADVARALDKIRVACSK